MSGTIFEKGVKGRSGRFIPENDCPVDDLSFDSPRKGTVGLPEVGEQDVIRHYVELAGKNYHIDKGMYPLGSCTMKYNPVINEELAGLEGFTGLHPMQPGQYVQGALELMYGLERALCEITGMSAFSLQPVAGA